MILCVDIGNSHIFGGVFADNDIKLRFRYASQHAGTSDQIGLFLKQVLKENHIDSSFIEDIAICSVVPSLDYSIVSACIKYFNINPFMLKPGTKTGLKLMIKHPAELGADRIATAIAAIEKFPDKDLLVIDFGTATTICAISAKKEYLGGIIMPGMKTAMQALYMNTAKLAAVEILKPESALGKTTQHHIQAGLYYGQLGGIKEIIKNLTTEAFAGKKPVIIGTGGFANLFEKEKIFTTIMPDLVLDGLRVALHKNVRKI